MINDITIKDIIPYCNGAKIQNLRKINFIYGNNGSGKTTISKIIQGKYEQGKYDISWEDNKQQEAFVYNSCFIEENFIKDEEIKGVFTLGKKSGEIQTKIIEKTNQIKSLQEDIGNLDIKIKDNSDNRLVYKKGVDEEFWKTKIRLDTELPNFSLILSGVRGSKQVFADTIITHYSNNKDTIVSINIDDLKYKSEKCYSENIECLPLIQELDLSNIEELEKNKILEKSIVGKEDLEISKLISTLHNADWVGEGSQFLKHSNGKCPFCQQRLPIDFEEKLSEYFDEEYKRNKEILEKFRLDYSLIADKLIEDIKLKMQEIKKDDIQKYYLKIKDIIDKNKKIIEEKTKLLAEKASIILVSQECKEINKFITSANQEIEKYNKFVQDIERQRKELREQTLQYICFNLKNSIISFFKKDKEYLEVGEKLKTEKKEKDALKEQNNTELHNYEKEQTDVKQTLIDINDLLKKFGFNNFKLDYGKDNHTYKLIRNNGDSAYKTMSEGEKNLISFLYFYNLLKGSQNGENINTERVVVFDDPISSLDNDILFYVSSSIRILYRGIVDGSSPIKQLFVLSHNLYFFEQVSYNLKDAKIDSKYFGFWLIRKLRDYSDIENKTYEKNPIKSTYQMLWRTIKQISENEDKSQYDMFYVQNTMRRIIEYYFKFIGYDSVSLWKLFNNYIFSNVPVEHQSVYKAFLSWIQVGSHGIFDDVNYSPEGDIEIFLEAFKAVFSESKQISHYNCMMNQ